MGRASLPGWLLGSWLVALTLWSCSPECEKPALSFYHWESTLDLTEEEQKRLNEHQVKRLYVRFFDVDVSGSGQPQPVGPLSTEVNGLGTLEVVPVVFLTNRTFLNLAEGQEIDLARNVAKRISWMADSMGCQLAGEVQFDCDWTGSTRAIFFSFLEAVRKELPEGTVLSSTIRLHQVSDWRGTGVPPVDRGALMCYNVGSLNSVGDSNSILDPALVEPYLTSLADYPLPLDMALPIFSWGVVRRGQGVVHLYEGLRADELADAQEAQLVSEVRFQVVESHFRGGFYLRKGDEIRVESVSVSHLEATARLLSAARCEPRTLLFYHLSPSNLDAYPASDLETLRDRLR